MRVVNLTPHDINLYDNESNLIATYSPSGIIARIAEQDSDCAPILLCKETDIATEVKVPVLQRTYQDIENLPPKLIGVIYIVSALVAMVRALGTVSLAEDSYREDLYSPDTGPNGAVRYGGKIIGTKALIRI